MRKLERTKKNMTRDSWPLSEEEDARVEAEMLDPNSAWRQQQKRFNESDRAKRLDEQILRALDRGIQEEEEIRKQHNLKD